MKISDSIKLLTAAMSEFGDLEVLVDDGHSYVEFNQASVEENDPRNPKGPDGKFIVLS